MKSGYIGKNIIAKSRMNQNACRKGKLQVHGKVGRKRNKIGGDENFKNEEKTSSYERENFWKTSSTAEILSKGWTHGQAIL